jgi:peroxiredoxin Q/BCP
LGVSFDSQKALKNFKLKHNLPFNFLSDSNKEMGSDYGVNKYYFFPSRKTFLIDEKGILIHIFDDIDLYSHPKEVLSFFNKDLKE